MTTGDRRGRSSDTGARVFLALLSLYPAASDGTPGTLHVLPQMLHDVGPCGNAFANDRTSGVVDEGRPQRDSGGGGSCAITPDHEKLQHLAAETPPERALGRSASTMLSEIQPADPSTYAALVTAVLTLAVAASWIPARRAMRVEPAAVLRRE